MFACTRKKLVFTIASSICLLSKLGFANLALAFPVLDCETANSSFVVITPQGAEPVGKYCDFQEKLPQVATNDTFESQPSTTKPSKPVLKFGKPYFSKGSICRDRGIDTICLSPNSASKLNEL